MTTTQTTAPAPLTTPRALAALQDAIRAEVRAELLADLQAWRATYRPAVDDTDYQTDARAMTREYLDGVDDAIQHLGG